jgi:hypothetical protein
MEAYEPAHMANLVITSGTQCSLELNKHLAAFPAASFGNEDRGKRIDRETIDTFCFCCQLEQSEMVTSCDSLLCST